MLSSWRRRLGLRRPRRLRIRVLQSLLIIAPLVGVVLVIWVLPVLLTRYPSVGLTAAARLKAENDVRTPLLAALAVLGAAWIASIATIRAAWSSGEAEMIAREGQMIDRQKEITARYSKAIDQLGALF